MELWNNSNTYYISTTTFNEKCEYISDYVKYIFYNNRSQIQTLDDGYDGYINYFIEKYSPIDGDCMYVINFGSTDEIFKFVRSDDSLPFNVVFNKMVNTGNIPIKYYKVILRRGGDVMKKKKKDKNNYVGVYDVNKFNIDDVLNDVKRDVKIKKGKQ